MSGSDSDSEDGAPPPPARHDTGCFGPIVPPGGSGAPSLEVPSNKDFVSSTLSHSGMSSPMTEGVSPMSQQSSFRWNTAQSFRIIAKGPMRRNTSFQLSSSQLEGATPLSSPHLGSSGQPTDSGGGQDDPKHVIKECLTTIKNSIRLHGDDGSQSKSTLSSNLIKGPAIGSGGYATVFAGVDKITGELVAIKEIQVSGTRNSNPEQYKAIEDEFALLRQLRHRNVISYSLFEHSVSAGVCRIVMEFCSGGSAQTMLNKFQALPEPICKHMAKQIFAGLAFIHKEGIIHRDIKPANILCHANGTTKLADFGCSRRIGEMAGKASHVLGTPVYMAPEYIKGQTHRKSDVWAAACTLLELATCKTPWHHTKLTDNLSLMFYISTGYERPQIPYNDISAEFAEFLEDCFIRDVDRRPEASEMLNHPWLTKEGDEDLEGVLAIDEIGACQCTELCEQITGTYGINTVAGPTMMLSPGDSGGDLNQLRVLSGAAEGRNLSSHSLVAEHSLGEPSGLQACESFLVVSGLTKGNSESRILTGGMVSAPASRLTSPVEKPLEVTMDSADDDTPEVPTGPVRMEVPVEACGRSMLLDLEVQPEDLQVTMLANRRKSFAVSFSDNLRAQISAAMAQESLKSPRESSLGGSPAKSDASPLLESKSEVKT